MVDVLLVLSNPPKAFRTWADAPEEPDEDESEEPVRADYYPQRRLTSAERAELVDRYLAGERAFELALAYGLHRQTVARVLVDAGARRPRLMTESERIEAVQLYSEGWTCQAIGHELGRSRDAVRQALHVAGVQLRSGYGNHGR